MPDQEPPLGVGDEHSRTLESGKVLTARIKARPDGGLLLAITIDGEPLRGQKLPVEDARGLAHFILELQALTSAQPDGWPFGDS